jgi:membrane protease YdiL (CAAX protease family)
MVLAAPGFMLGSVLIIAIITRKTSSLLNVVKLQNWRYYYIPEGIGLQIVLFFPLAIITVATMNLINKLKPVFPDQVKFLTETSQAVQTFALSSDWTSFAVFAISAVIVAPIIEEIIFRGVVFSCLKKYTTTSISVVTASFFFAAFHFNFIQFIPLFLLGITFQLLFIYHKSIFPCMIYHSINNSFAVIILLLMKLKIINIDL